MKIAALVVLGSALILTSCGKKGDDNKSESSTTDSVAQGGVIKEGTLVNGNIDLHKTIRGTSWTLSKIVDHENKEVTVAKKTELSFDKDKNVLKIINSNGNMNVCSTKTGAKYEIIKSSNTDEYLIQEINCTFLSTNYTPSMAIIKINKDNTISINRHILSEIENISGIIKPTILNFETYTKN
ncbi:hypothetical protein [Silvanigrella sp.]|jgi:hypothetical protein|uniref:hypothetical protein n=1 Tax=Silvanigrella sp. TaxID=2024976 RepID=UPI0037C5A4DA